MQDDDRSRRTATSSGETSSEETSREAVSSEAASNEDTPSEDRSNEDTQPRIAWRERLEERVVAAIKRRREEEGDESPLPWPAAVLALFASLVPRRRAPRERPA